MERWKQLFLARQKVRQLMLGQGLVEYALILIFVAVVLIGLLVILGPGIRHVYEDIVDVLNDLS